MNSSYQQSQEYRYFYIDRKLSHPSLGQVIQAMQTLESFIPEIKKIQILDSIMMRLLEFYKNNHNYYIKIRSANLLAAFSSKIQKIHSKQEVINTMAKLLKHIDQRERILTIKTVTSLSKIFQKDLSVYHTLLSNLYTQSSSKIQRIQSYKCLKRFLGTSRYLSTIYGKGLSQIINYGKINKKIIIGLCLAANFKCSDYVQIIQKIKGIMDFNCIKMKTLFANLFMKFIIQNYHLVKLYWKQYQNILPELTIRVQFVQNYYYSFLKTNQSNYLAYSSESTEELLDKMFYLKKYSRISQIDQKSLSNIIQTEISENRINQNVILLTFYCFNSFDLQILQSLKISQCFKNEKYYYLIRLLKICLVTSNFFTALNIIEQFLFTNFSLRCIQLLILLKIYCNFQLEHSQKQLIFLQQLNQYTAITFSNSKLSEVTQIWLDYYQKSIYLEWCMIDQNLRLKNVNLIEQLRLMKHIKTNNSSLIHEQSVKILPLRHIFHANKKSNIYFTKNTINQLFSALNQNNKQ